MEEDYLLDENRLLRTIIDDKDTIIRDKDLIIGHLMEKIEWLNERLLGGFHSGSVVNKRSDVKKTIPLPNENLKMKLPTDHQESPSTGVPTGKAVEQPVARITLESVKEGIHAAQGSLPAGCVDGCADTDRLVGEQWKLVSGRRRNKRPTHKMVIGADQKKSRGHSQAIYGELERENIALKSVPRSTFLHVSKLDPSTTVDQLTEYLQTHCPEVTCEKLNARFPDIYSSFKVKVEDCNLDKILTPACWPRGVRVNKFFQRRTRVPPST